MLRQFTYPFAPALRYLALPLGILLPLGPRSPLSERHQNTERLAPVEAYGERPFREMLIDRDGGAG